LGPIPNPQSPIPKYTDIFLILIQNIKNVLLNNCS
jgi:hypothetical protein